MRSRRSSIRRHCATLEPSDVASPARVATSGAPPARRSRSPARCRPPPRPPSRTPRRPVRASRCRSPAPRAAPTGRGCGRPACRCRRPGVRAPRSRRGARSHTGIRGRALRQRRMRSSVVVGLIRKIGSSPASISGARSGAASSTGRSRIEHAVHAGIGRRARERGRRHPRDRVGVGEQHDRRLHLRSDPADDVERARQGHAARERALGRALDDRAVGERVGERHPDFEHVGPGAVQRDEDPAPRSRRPGRRRWCRSPGRAARRAAHRREGRLEAPHQRAPCARARLGC